jgi:ADP-ribosylglycohydrolase
MHDVRDPTDLLRDEYEQRLLSGFDVAQLANGVAAAIGRRDPVRLRSLYEELVRGPHRSDWPYNEPSEPQVIVEIAHSQGAGVGVPAWHGSDTELFDRIEGGWLGRCIGCCMGKPVEGLTRIEIAAYADAVGDGVFRQYLPLLEPLPPGVARLHPSAAWATAGRFTITPRDDDIDWAILCLHVLDVCGASPGVDDFATAWLDRLPFTQTYTAERAAYRNLVRGLHPPETATVENPYREWIGALIRADVLGYISPGDPASAVDLALVDAGLPHTGNGVYGEVWAAALIASAFTVPTPRAALQAALRWVPATSRLYEALLTTDELSAAGTAGTTPWTSSIIPSTRIRGSTPSTMQRG